MDRKQLLENIVRKKSYLCVGLDSDINKIPEFLQKENDPVFEFNKVIVDATARQTVCYKPNLAFYESNGIKGWKSLTKTIDYIRSKHPDIFLIADAKRGDIGNTSKMYARAFFEQMDFDAITVSPYMGQDSVEPFLSYNDKWVIVLALTSNKGSENFQQVDTGEGSLYEKVLKNSSEWGNPGNLMFVVGATKARKLEEIRKIVPEHFLLVPGVGAQGGSLSEVSKYGLNNECGLLVNASRSIIYAGKDKDFANQAYEEALKIQQEMKRILAEKNISL